MTTLLAPVLAPLPGRGVIAVDGETAASFLNGLLTADIPHLAQGSSQHAALLSPQGKIVFDFFVTVQATDGGPRILLEIDHAGVADAIKRLNFYKLRAKIAIYDMSPTHGVAAYWGGAPGPLSAGVTAYADPRTASLGHRIIATNPDWAAIAHALTAHLATEADYHAHRLALLVPEAGRDYALGDTFPHEACMDQWGGVDFHKGCYIGQEVVSRMQHRGTARKRLVGVAGADLPDQGAEILAGDHPIGTLGSHVGGQGLALVRLDRLAEARASGVAITTGDSPVTILKPGWARYEVADG